MLILRNDGARTTNIELAANEAVPFDYAVATNGLVTFKASDNAGVINQPGRYWLIMTVTGVSGAAGSVELQAYSDGVLLPYAAAAESCDGKTTQSITLMVPVDAVLSAGGLAEITFHVSAAFTLSNAFGGIQLVP